MNPHVRDVLAAVGFVTVIVLTLRLLAWLAAGMPQ